MNIIIMPKGSGKTNAAIKRANEIDAYLVVMDRSEAARIGHLCKRFPITIDEFLKTGMAGSFARTVVIDNIEMLFSRLAPGIKIDTITCTGGSHS